MLNFRTPETPQPDPAQDQFSTPAVDHSQAQTDFEIRQEVQLLERKLKELEGVYIDNDPDEPPKGVRLKLQRREGESRALVIDAWQEGQVYRLLDFPVAEILPHLRHPEIPFVLYLTIAKTVDSTYGNRLAPLSYFLLLFKREDERVISINVKEYGQDLFRLQLAPDTNSRAGRRWRESAARGRSSGISLANFIAEDYPKPPFHESCEKWLSARRD